jgi:hypothetical protein
MAGLLIDSGVRSRRRLAAAAAGLVAVSAAWAQSGPAASAAPAAQPPAKSAFVAARPPARSQRGAWYYTGRYGVDRLQVRSISSGMSLEFRYRVVNPEKAKALGDKNSKPALVDWKTGQVLTVPTLEKIGQLRQMTQLEQGREYWMVFANPGKLIKPGDRVNVVVGSIRLDGLTVE